MGKAVRTPPAEPTIGIAPGADPGGSGVSYAATPGACGFPWSCPLSETPERSRCRAPLVTRAVATARNEVQRARFSPRRFGTLPPSAGRTIPPASRRPPLSSGRGGADTRLRSRSGHAPVSAPVATSSSVALASTATSPAGRGSLVKVSWLVSGSRSMRTSVLGATVPRRIISES